MAVSEPFLDGDSGIGGYVEKKAIQRLETVKGQQEEQQMTDRVQAQQPAQSTALDLPKRHLESTAWV
jgi:hypothetical protein